MNKVDQGFGMARLKQEGASAHPEDIYIHCGCEQCQAAWDRQLKAYNDHFKLQDSEKE